MTDAVRMYDVTLSDFRLVVAVGADLPEMTEQQRDVIAAKMQAAFDRLLLKAIYGDPESIAQSNRKDDDA